MSIQPRTEAAVSFGAVGSRPLGPFQAAFFIAAGMCPFYSDGLVQFPEMHMTVTLVGKYSFGD